MTAWRSIVDAAKLIPRTRVGPATSAIERTQGGTTWLGVWTSPVDLHRDSGLDRNVYALARCIASESGTADAQLVQAVGVAEVVINAARRKAIEPYQYLVQLTSSAYAWTRFYYGSQRGRRASTRQDPDARGVEIARRALNTPPCLVADAVTFYEPDLQDKGSIKADEIARRWARDGYEWIGPLPGIHSYKGFVFLRDVGPKADPSALLAAIEAGRRGAPIAGEAAVASSGQPWWALVAGLAAVIAL